MSIQWKSEHWTPRIRRWSRLLWWLCKMSTWLNYISQNFILCVCLWTTREILEWTWEGGRELVSYSEPFYSWKMLCICWLTSLARSVTVPLSPGSSFHFWDSWVRLYVELCDEGLKLEDTQCMKIRGKSNLPVAIHYHGLTLCVPPNLSILSITLHLPSPCCIPWGLQFQHQI